MKTLPEVAREAELLTIQYIVDCYRGSGGREPSITVAHIAGYLGQHRFNEPSNPYLTGSSYATKWLSRIARVVLGRLVRRNLLRTSIGIGESGREAQMYDPTPAGKAFASMSGGSR